MGRFLRHSVYIFFNNNRLIAGSGNGTYFKAAASGAYLGDA